GFALGSCEGGHERLAPAADAEHVGQCDDRHRLPKVALDRARVAHLRTIRVLARVAEGPALAQVVPQLVQFDSHRLEPVRVSRNASVLLALGGVAFVAAQAALLLLEFVDARLHLLVIQSLRHEPKRNGPAWRSLCASDTVALSRPILCAM